AQPEPPRPSLNNTPLDRLADAATKICQTTPVYSQNNQLTLDGKANAELAGVINNLVSGGISGAAKYRSGSSYGVLQQDLAGSMAAGNNCRLKALEILVGTLLK